MQNAIKKAIQGGYVQHKDYGSGAFMKSVEEMCLDPLFWQAIGEQQGWIYGNMWKIEWHLFIDHLAEGKPVDEFFDYLLK